MVNSRNSISIYSAMTVDVEDYFQVSAFESSITRQQWDKLPHRVEKNTHKILDIFDEFDIKATFFTLGWVAEKYPELVRRVAKDGHEVACHGYDHKRISDLNPSSFKSDVETSKKILEDIAGQRVFGYRAPSYSIIEQTLWAHNVLEEVGFFYSSSVYPVKHDLYGIPDAPRFIYEPIAGSDFKEIPITTVSFAGRNIPCGGGGFFRLYPYFFSKYFINSIVGVEKRPSIFYFHPWEIDHEQPRQKGLGYKSQFRHYLNLDKTEQRLRWLLRDFNWDTMLRVFMQMDGEKVI